MSYCVNCGVELAKSEKSCPLCGVEAVNPAEPWKEPVSRPYPATLERVMRGVDRQYFAVLTTLLLAIPLSVCVVVDLLSAQALTWSSYVVGAGAVSVATVLLPVGIGAGNPWRNLLVDALSVLALLWLIDFKSTPEGLRWFLPIALPTVLALCAIMAVLILYFRKRRNKSILVSIALMLIGAGLYACCIELILRLGQGASAAFHWSLYALLPCVLSAGAFILINRRNKWKEAIRKRLFF